MMNSDFQTPDNLSVQKSYGRKKRIRAGLVGKKAVLGVSNEDKELLKNIADARNEWLDANSCFEHAFDEKLVDYFTYKIKACEARYAYFINLAKEKGLTCGFMQLYTMAG